MLIEHDHGARSIRSVAGNSPLIGRTYVRLSISYNAGAEGNSNSEAARSRNLADLCGCIGLAIEVLYC